MSSEPCGVTAANWRSEPPILSSSRVRLREPKAADADALFDLLSGADASRFGIEEPVLESAVFTLIDRAARDRQAGTALSFVVEAGSGGRVDGFLQVRALDPVFEAAEWECTLAPAVRGSGVFLDAARLVASFVFGSVGAHRLEARALLQNGRANGALRKIGAVQEGILRRSARRGSAYVDQVLWSVLKDDWSDRSDHRESAAPQVH